MVPSLALVWPCLSSGLIQGCPRVSPVTLAFNCMMEESHQDVCSLGLARTCLRRGWGVDHDFQLLKPVFSGEAGGY